LIPVWRGYFICLLFGIGFVKLIMKSLSILKMRGRIITGFKAKPAYKLKQTKRRFSNNLFIFKNQRKIIYN